MEFGSSQIINTWRTNNGATNLLTGENGPQLLYEIGSSDPEMRRRVFDLSADCRTTATCVLPDLTLQWLRMDDAYSWVYLPTTNSRDYSWQLSGNTHGRAYNLNVYVGTVNFGENTVGNAIRLENYSDLESLQQINDLTERAKLIDEYLQENPINQVNGYRIFLLQPTGAPSSSPIIRCSLNQPWLCRLPLPEWEMDFVYSPPATANRTGECANHQCVDIKYPDYGNKTSFIIQKPTFCMGEYAAGVTFKNLRLLSRSGGTSKYLVDYYGGFRASGMDSRTVSATTADRSDPNAIISVGELTPINNDIISPYLNLLRRMGDGYQTIRGSMSPITFYVNFNSHIPLSSIFFIAGDDKKELFWRTTCEIH
jgi:hypothetical protein